MRENKKEDQLNKGVNTCNMMAKFVVGIQETLSSTVKTGLLEMLIN